MIGAMTSTFPICQPCPPDACTCGHERLLEMPGANLRLTRQEEKRLLERLENLESLADLERMQRRMYEQLGIRLDIARASTRCAACAPPAPSR